jgi:hypothetical protein
VAAAAFNLKRIQEATVGTLIFVCPNTGQEVSTGVEVDRATFRKLARTDAEISCPHCRKDHALSSIAVWLVSETTMVDDVDDNSTAKSAA